MTTTYGNLSLSDLIIYNNTTDTSANLTFNTNANDGNFAMSTGLDISGSLVFAVGPSSNSEQFFTGIPLNLAGAGTNCNLIFPSLSGALTPYATCGSLGSNWEAPVGLGITWSITGYGETDLIGYGGGNPGSGGVTVWGYDCGNPASGDNETRIADFWPNGSIIYNNLTLNNSNLVLSSGNQIQWPGNIVMTNNTGDGNIYINTGLDVNGSFNVSNAGTTFGFYSYTVDYNPSSSSTQTIYFQLPPSSAAIVTNYIYTAGTYNYTSIYACTQTFNANSGNCNAISNTNAGANLTLQYSNGYFSINLNQGNPGSMGFQFLGTAPSYGPSLNQP